MSTIPADWHNCATCSHWCGDVTPNPFNTFVDVDTRERARCSGGGFWNATTNAMASCDKWDRRFR